MDQEKSPSPSVRPFQFGDGVSKALISWGIQSPVLHSGMAVAQEIYHFGGHGLW